MKIRKKPTFLKKLTITGVVAAVLFGIGFLGIILEQSPEKTVIDKKIIKDIAKGRTEGSNISKAENILKTDSTLLFTSEEISPVITGANAAILTWNQTGNSGVKIELRTKNNGKWSSWSEASSDEERKDNTSTPHSALILGYDIGKIQYRVAMDSTNSNSDTLTEVNLEKSAIEVLDTTRGPSPDKPKNIIEQGLQKLGLLNVVRARMDGPRIYSRDEWGSPQPNSSEWTPEYAPLYRAIVHHTAMPEGADPAASIRAIWQYHTYTNGWGDIGYNYLVDSKGNIYQGRYYDHNQAAAQKGEVIGGHAYSNNGGTTGIAALGDFTSARPSDRMVDAIADITAFKLANYGVNPSGIGQYGPNVIGHREAVSTSCPGDQLFSRLGDIRSVGDIYYTPRVAMNRYDLTNQGQGYDNYPTIAMTMNAGEARESYFDLKNEGDETWFSSGPNPTYLATDGPRDRTSVFYTPGNWKSSNRPATFSEKVVTDANGQKSLESASTIKPGEAGRFRFIMTTAQTMSGSYLERFQLVVDGKEWFTRNLLLSTTVNVIPQIYSWRPIAQHIYKDSNQSVGATTNLKPGEKVYLVLMAQNTGNQTWYKDDASKPPVLIAPSYYRDRTSSFCDSTWINCTRAGTFQENQVAPGEIATFGFWIRMPSPSRDFLYYDHYSLVAERVMWMNTEPGVSWPVKVTN